MTKKKIIVGEGYNNGDKYEDKITKILIDKEILPKDYVRAGASDKADVEINLKGKKIKIEIKGEKKVNPDFGQVSLIWSKDKGWFWREIEDKKEVIKIYKGLNIIKEHINFIPKRFSKNKSELTMADQKNDSQMEKSNIQIPVDTLFKYYEAKNTYYIQIQNLGFFHLAKDIFDIGTLQFPGKIYLRLRHKVHDSYEYKMFPKDKDQIKHFNTKKEEWVIRYKSERTPPHKRYCTGKKTPGDYSFFGVMKRDNKIASKLSEFDIEELDGREFPFKI